VQLLARTPELAASMVAWGVLPALVQLLRLSAVPVLQLSALGILYALVSGHQERIAQLAAASEDCAELLLQAIIACQPPASGRADCMPCVWATALLAQVCSVDEAAARRATAAGAVPQLARALSWGAQRLERLGRQRGQAGPWDEQVEQTCAAACFALRPLLADDGSSGAEAAARAAQQQGVPQLAQQALEHSRNARTLRTASQLLALLRDPGRRGRAVQGGAAEVLRRLQPCSQPDRAAALAAALAQLAAGQEQEAEAVGGGSAPAPVEPGSGAAAGAGGGREQQAAVPAAVAQQCAACGAQPPAGRKFQLCAGCRAVRYCSPACQRAAWLSGHRAACKARREQGKAG
jgi:hypothetical protein